MEPQTSTSTQMRPAGRRQWKPTVFGGDAKIMLLFFSIFGAAGLGLTYFAYTMLTETLDLRARGTAVSGTVTRLEYRRDSDGDGAYYPEVTFTAQDGREFRFMNNSGSNPASFDEGETVGVLYPPENPQDARIDAFFSMWGGVLICGLIGAVFSCIGLGGLLYYVRKRRENAWLLGHGRRISAEVSQVEHPGDKEKSYYIHAQWLNPKDNKIYVFTSQPIPFNPEAYVGASVEVLINPDKPSTYAMDTGFLPELG